MTGKMKLTFSILVAVLIILVPFEFLIFNSSFQIFLVDKVSNIHNESVVINVVEYFRGGELDKGFFSPQAISHMKDVKDLIFYYEILLIVLCLAIGCILYYYERKNIPLPFKQITNFSLILIGFLLVCSLFFSYSFVLFHKIVFTNNDWMFNSSDSLVNLYTENFFLWFFLTGLGISLIIVLIVYLSINEKVKKFAKGLVR